MKTARLQRAGGLAMLALLMLAENTMGEPETVILIDPDHENEAAAVLALLKGANASLPPVGSLVVEYDFDCWKQDTPENKVRTSARLTVDSLVPSRFKLECDPLGIMGPGVPEGYPGHVLAECYDGQNLLQLRTQESISPPGHTRTDGTIRAWDPKHNLFSLPVNYLAFTTLGCTYGPHEGQGLLAVLQRPDQHALILTNTDEELAIDLKTYSDAKYRLTFDPRHGYALRKIEWILFDYQTGKEQEVVTSFEVLEYQAHPLSPFPLPVRAKSIVRTADGELHGELKVRRLATDLRPPGEVYKLPFPVGTQVKDKRLGLRFRVGETAEEAMRTIRRQVINPDDATP